MLVPRRDGPGIISLLPPVAKILPPPAAKIMPPSAALPDLPFAGDRRRCPRLLQTRRLREIVPPPAAKMIPPPTAMIMPPSAARFTPPPMALPNPPVPALELLDTVITLNSWLLSSPQNPLLDSALLCQRHASAFLYQHLVSIPQCPLLQGQSLQGSFLQSQSLKCPLLQGQSLLCQC